MSLDHGQTGHRFLAQAALTLALLLTAAAPATAEEGAKPPADQWRPVDGIYASAGADFNDRCLEYGEAIIDLSEKSVSTREQECSIVKLTDTAPGTLTLDTSCVAEENEQPRKETMSLKKIDDKTISVRETKNGKFTGPGAQTTYCPEMVQRFYASQKASK